MDPARHLPPARSERDHDATRRRAALRSAEYFLSPLLARARRAVCIGKFLRRNLEFRHGGLEVFIFEFFRRHTRVFLDLFRLAFGHLVSPERDHSTNQCNTPPRDSPPPSTSGPSDSHPPQHVPSLASAHHVARERPRHTVRRPAACLARQGTQNCEMRARAGDTCAYCGGRA